MTSALHPEDLVTLPHEERERLHRQRSRTRVEIGPGMLLGTKYALLSELGRGGVGAVYAAENTWTGRRVAVKVLRVEYTCGPRTIARFRHEAQVASRLRHPHIVDVIDMGFDEPNNAPYIVEELLEGEGFDAVLARSPGRRVSPEEALRVMLPVMDALAACHAAGVVHRDVKPSNIFLCRTPRGEVVPKLIDFGVSKWPHDRRHVTVAGALYGTPRYMAPEQARGEPGLDARADVWAVGVTLFEALTGRCPFEKTPQRSVLAQAQRATPPRVRDVAPDVPADVAAVIDRALRTRREDRFATMREFITALQGCEAAQALRPSGVRTIKRARTKRDVAGHVVRWVRERPRTIAVAALVVMVDLLALLLLPLFWRGA